MRSERVGLRGLGTVFWVAVSIAGVFAAWGLAANEGLAAAMKSSLDWLTANFGWAYLVVTLALVIFLVWLACSRYGGVRLGRDEDRPEFSTTAWLSMILSAIMGIGLVSYGVAEPISHFAAPPHGLAEPGSEEAAIRALQYSFFDWGLQAWAVFATFGLAFAYSTYRKGRKPLVSQLFVPLIGERANGPLGKAIDVLAIFSTLFGTTTSLGLGAQQVNNGLDRVVGLDVNEPTQVAIVAIVTAIFTISAVSGVAKGIKYLSQLSAGISVLLFIFVLAVGPTVFVINLYIESLGTWASDYFRMSLQGTAFGDLEWMNYWTYFMLAWWVSWGAFVGVFLARISRGRTIRGFIGAVLVVPSAVFFTWFAIFGGSAIRADMTSGANIAEQTGEDINSAFFALLDTLPLSTITSIVAIFLVVIFFVSGADANTYVLGMLSSRGSITPHRSVLILWGVLTGVTAIVLLLAGGLSALQNTVIVTSAPFLLIIAALAVAFYKQLADDERIDDTPIAPATAEPEPIEELTA